LPHRRRPQHPGLVDGLVLSWARRPHRAPPAPTAPRGWIAVGPAQPSLPRGFGGALWGLRAQLSPALPSGNPAGLCGASGPSSTQPFGCCGASVGLGGAFGPSSAQPCPAAIHRWGSAKSPGPAQQQGEARRWGPSVRPEPWQPYRGDERLERAPRPGPNSAAVVVGPCGFRGIALPPPGPEQFEQKPPLGNRPPRPSGPPMGPGCLRQFGGRGV